MASGSWKKEENKTYTIVVDIGQNGERKQKKIRGFKSKKEAENAITKILNEVNEGAYLEPSKMTVAELMDKWVETKGGNMTRLTVDSYNSYISKHVSPSIGTITLGKLDSDDIESLVKDLREKGLSDSTVQRIFNITVTALNFALTKKWIKENVAKQVDRPRIARRKLQVWSPKEVKLFLDHIKSYRYFMAFYLAIHTGMRQGEILGLPWSNVDTKNKIIRVTQTLEHDAKNLKQGTKTLAGIRSIPISQEVADRLEQHRELIDKEKDLAGIIYQDNGLVICTNIGKPLFADSVTKFMRKRMGELPLNRIRFHDLRHTFASLMLLMGVHIKAVSEMLGHNSVTITMDTYSHLLPNIKTDAAESLSNLLNDDE